MRRISLLLLALSLTLRTAAAVPEEIDRYLTARTQLGQFSGSVLVAHEGKILLRKGYGYANLEHLAPNTAETRFEIASLTKAFTAFAVHDLARHGKLRLDEPACNYVEACPDAWKPITIAHLIHHRSGIPDYEEKLEMASKEYYARLLVDDAAASTIDWARARPLEFAPGSKFQYSNTAYLLLGLIIEKVSGKSYEEFLRERLFTPLRMTSTVHIDRSRVQRNRAEGYTHQAPLFDLVKGFSLTGPHLRRVKQLPHTPPQADGGLLSTVDDLYKWASALLGDGSLDANVVRELLTPEGDYAFGWYVGKRFERTRIWHTGVLPGTVSAIDLYPDSKTVIVWISNLDRARMGNITRELTSIVFGRPYDIPRSHPVTKIDAAAAQRFFGSYKLSDGRTMTIGHEADGGMLLAGVKDQFTAGLLRESELVFYAPMWEGTITFTEDGLVMRNAGVDITGKRE
jgi:CubicO group peptidase (beta-lactamase class C family)